MLSFARRICVRSVSLRDQVARRHGGRRRWTGAVLALESRQLLSGLPTGMMAPDLVKLATTAHRSSEMAAVVADQPLSLDVSVDQMSRAEPRPGYSFQPGTPLRPVVAPPEAPQPVVSPPILPPDRVSPEVAFPSIALTDLTVSYMGVDPGLYGDGQNTPPPELENAAAAAAARIQPLDRQGKPSPNGRIGLVMIGPSTTMMQGKVFRQVAHRDPAVSPYVRVINAAQNGMVAQSWASTNRPWMVLRAALGANRVTRDQVQAVWIKAPSLFPQRQGGFPAHAERYADDLVTIVQRAKKAFPNLQIAYLSSEVNFTFNRKRTINEPYSFEEAFGVRTLIDRQLQGDRRLNSDPAQGPVKAPVLLWGPYLWAPTTHPRADGLIWTRSDFQPDGVHPSQFGSAKVASQLHRFLLNDPTARHWYRRS